LKASASVVGAGAAFDLAARQAARPDTRQAKQPQSPRPAPPSRGLYDLCALAPAVRLEETAVALPDGLCAVSSDAGPRLNRICPLIAVPCSGVCVFFSILVGAPMGVILMRADADDVLLVNPQARGYLQRLDIAENASVIREALEGRSSPSAPGAEWRTISWRGRSYEWSDYFLDAGRLCFIADVTDRKRYEAIAIGADLEKATARLLSTMRHEIASPLSALQAGLSVLLDNYDAFDDEKRLAYLRRCLEQARALKGLLARLQTYHSVDAIEPGAIELAPLIERHAQLTADALAGVGIELNVQSPPAHCLVLAHAQAFQQVLTNLTVNAVEAIEGSAGGRVRISIVPGPRYVAVEVSDDGPGIPEDVLPHVFTPLFTTKPRGTGLGLAIVRQMMLRQRGDVEIQSREGNGTTVRLLLARAADRSRVSAEASAAEWAL